MINTKNLRKKGIPIAREKSKNIIDNNISVKDKKLPLQVMVSEELFEEFSTLAGQKFGFKKGAKSKLFLELWNAYNSMVT